MHQDLDGIEWSEAFYRLVGSDGAAPNPYSSLDSLQILCESFFESYDKKDRMKKDRFLRLIERVALQNNVPIRLSQKSSVSDGNPHS